MSTAKFLSSGAFGTRYALLEEFGRLVVWSGESCSELRGCVLQGRFSMLPGVCHSYWHWAKTSQMTLGKVSKVGRGM